MPSILPLVADRLSFAANGKDLLTDVTFSIPRGGLTAILGPNGAGKSLTLRLCHGLLSPTSGKVSWSGAYAGPGRGHAMVFQRPVMLRRSALANVVHALSAMGAPRPVDKARIALARFGLEPLSDRPARLLSGGEQQRLALARAWALDPELMFLDEPSSQLDPGAARQVEDLVRSLLGEGMTILMTTHDLGQARRLADRILFFHRGRLLEDQAAAAFFREPSAPEARSFLAGDLLW